MIGNQIEDDREPEEMKCWQINAIKTVKVVLYVNAPDKETAMKYFKDEDFDDEEETNSPSYDLDYSIVQETD